MAKSVRQIGITDGSLASLIQLNYTEHIRPVNGIGLHTVEAGPPDAPVILFLHGFPEFWYGWHRQIAYFAEAGYRVIVPDQRGYNLSDKPENVRSYQVEQLVLDVLALIAITGAPKVTLVGHDWGAVVAWLVAEWHPEVLHRLVIINVPHPAVMFKTLKRNPRQVLKSWYIGFFQLPWLPERLLRWNHCAGLSRMLQTTSLPGTFTEEELRLYREAWQQPGALRAMVNWYRAARYFNQQTLPGQRIAVPTLILWGVKDAALVPEMARLSADRCQQATLQYFGDATHWLPHEKSTEVNGLIFAFMNAKFLT